MTQLSEQKKGISFEKRAAFSRRDVISNTTVTAEPLRSRTSVIYIDINNPSSNYLKITALAFYDCHEWIVNLIRSWLLIFL